MKFGHLIEYNMRNTFLKKSCTECSAETNLRDLFLKKLKLRISLDQQPEAWYSLLFAVCPSQGLPKYIETKVLTNCF